MAAVKIVWLPSSSAPFWSGLVSAECTEHYWLRGDSRPQTTPYNLKQFGDGACDLNLQLFFTCGANFFGNNLWDMGGVTMFSTRLKSRKWELRKIWIPRCAKIVLKYLTWSYDDSSKSFRSEATRVQHRHTPGWKGRNWAHGTGFTSEMWALPRVSGCIFRLEIGNWCPPNTLIFLPYHIIDGRNRAPLETGNVISKGVSRLQAGPHFIHVFHSLQKPGLKPAMVPLPPALVQSFFHSNSTCGFYFTSSAFLRQVRISRHFHMTLDQLIPALVLWHQSCVSL